MTEGVRQADNARVSPARQDGIRTARGKSCTSGYAYSEAGTLPQRQRNQCAPVITDAARLCANASSLQTAVLHADVAAERAVQRPCWRTMGFTDCSAIIKFNDNR